MRVIIEQNYDKVSKWAANYIVNAINNHKENRPFVLGLPTGSTPLGVYKELIRLNKEKKVSFKNVITFNMDEYVNLEPTHDQSYHYFMYSNFFDHIDIKKSNINILNGMAKDLEKECNDYEKRIEKVGGIDLFMGGLGADGHIAFNEPFSSLNSRTRVKTLTYDTKVMNSRFFDNDINKVPSTALTVGVKTVCDSKQVLVLVTGHNKALALRDTIEGPVSHKCTASSLQLHPKAIVVCDENACDELKVSTYKYFKDIENL